MEMEKVSIIVPAYNVEKYIDRCMLSIIEQTYSNIEIILINDGSTDSTREKCEYWASRDERIVYISKKNEGQGVARNLAISKSSGDYLIFVDSDDWVSNNYVEKLCTQIVEKQSDIVFSDWVSVEEETGNSVVISQNAYELEEVVEIIEPSLCGKIFKKQIFSDNKIEQPAHFFEDIAVVPFVLLMARKYSYAEGCYYYYWKRDSSTTGSIATLEDRGIALEALVKLFVDKGLFSVYKKEIETFIKRRCRADLSKTRKLLTDKYCQVYEQHKRLLLEYFDEKLDDEIENRIVVWGSYNLYRVAKKFKLSEIEYRYGGTSVISVTSKEIPELNSLSINCSNGFREKNILCDWTKRFMHMHPTELKNVRVCLIDLLEERYPLGKCGEGYITISDAYEEVDTTNMIVNIVDEEERIALWEKQCKEFAERINKYFFSNKIVMVRMKLAEYFGENGKENLYDNIEEIRCINKRLDYYYDFLVKLLPSAIDVDVENEDDYYTDVNFVHGCNPSHLNKICYENIFRKIMDIIED